MVTVARVYKTAGYSPLYAGVTAGTAGAADADRRTHRPAVLPVYPAHDGTDGSGAGREYSLQGLFSLALLIASGCLWRQFPHHSLTSAGVVAVSSIILLVVYSVFGTLYLGNEFQPHVTDISAAFYFALVCMTTVGFGDIIPISVEARMFTLTVVVFGITIFTTSIVYIVGVVLRGTREIVKRGCYT